MLDPPFDEKRISAVFALLRMALVALDRDERAALYSPVARREIDGGFDLHADLFLTTRVWLIFDDVPDDNTGASLFMSLPDLLGAIKSIKAVPDDTARYVARVMAGSVARDSFDKLHRILHSERNRWYEPLRRALQERTVAIRLRKGEGYLIDDRRWLHGRAVVSGAVTSKRFHRLTFGLRSEAVWQKV
jgi:hypothetical protein